MDSPSLPGIPPASEYSDASSSSSRSVSSESSTPPSTPSRTGDTSPALSYSRSNSCLDLGARDGLSSTSGEVDDSLLTRGRSQDASPPRGPNSQNPSTSPDPAARSTSVSSASRDRSPDTSPTVSRIPSPALTVDNSRPTPETPSNQSTPEIPETPPEIPEIPEIPESPSSAADTTQSLASSYSSRQPFPHKKSAAEQEWERRKCKEGASNDAIDELMELVGLEDVKEQVLAIQAKVETCKFQGTDLKKERFNIVFQGNPGTGKTTVARIYARFLHSVGVLNSDNVKETSGAKLASFGGKKKVKKIIKKLVGTTDSPSSGVLFIDEAYQLTAPYSSTEGRQALDIILTEMENKIGQLVVVFVGYNKEMESFYEHNPGLASRIPYSMQFADFEDAELWNILHDKIVKKYNGQMEVEEGLGGRYMRIVIRRLARSRGIRGFGNARAVDNLLAKISERQAKRLAKIRKERSCQPEHKEYFCFTKEDLIGPEPSQAIRESAAWKKLEELIGLNAVKKSAEVMASIIQTNYQRELDEQKPLDFSLNRVFYGSPGTGKTTVAKLYGRIMADLGLLSNGEVVVKNPADFIGECLGKSEAKTRAILATTLGKVLIIDEAYMLNSGGPGKQQDTYRTAVIDTLVAEVQSVPGDDRCILLLGYEDQLKEMFENINPGLSRRFAIDNPFRFHDFDLPQLKQILQLKMEQQDLKAKDDAALSVAHAILDRARMRPSFCNAGEVDSCLTTAKLNYENRQLQKLVREPGSQKLIGKRDYGFILESEDFDPDFERNVKASANLRDRLQGIVANNIIEKLEEYEKRARVAKLRGVDPRRVVPTNFVFKGPPGTGKTTIARDMGKLYYDLGFLSTDEVVECTSADLIGQYVGHTSPKTRAQLNKGLGKVLFIDEAYRLTEGEFAAEAVNELISLLSSQKYEGKMIVILAGYTADMNKLMTVKPGLSGLFPEEIAFKNIKAEDCLILLERELKQQQISAPFLTDGSTDYNKLRKLIATLSIFPSWSNARHIKILAKNMSGCAFKAVSIDEAEQSISDLKEIPLSTEQAISCIRRLFDVEYKRWSQEGKVPKLSTTATQAAGQPHEATKSCTLTATEQAANQSSEVAQDPSGTNQAPSQPFTGFKGPTASPNGAHHYNMATESAAAHSHCTPMHTAKAAGDMNQTHQLSESSHHEHQLLSHHGHQVSHLEEALQALGETKEKRKAVQQKLQQLGACSAGYGWVKVSGGYKCSAGICFLSDGQVGK